MCFKQVTHTLGDPKRIPRVVVAWRSKEAYRLSTRSQEDPKSLLALGFPCWGHDFLMIFFWFGWTFLWFQFSLAEFAIQRNAVHAVHHQGCPFCRDFTNQETKTGPRVANSDLDTDTGNNKLEALALDQRLSRSSPVAFSQNQRGEPHTHTQAKGIYTVHYSTIQMRSNYCWQKQCRHSQYHIWWCWRIISNL